MKPTRSDHLDDEALARLGLSRETDIRLDAEGRFSCGGREVEHHGVAAAFARWIERTDQGRYVLRNDDCYAYIAVDGAPLHARGVEVEGEGAAARATLLLQGGEREPLRGETLREGPDGVLYASARDGTWAVRLQPAAALALGPLLREAADGVVLELEGRRHLVPRRADPLRP